MGKPFGCKLGLHSWIISAGSKRCKFCWKSYKEWKHEFWFKGGDMGG